MRTQAGETHPFASDVGLKRAEFSAERYAIATFSPST
jgi:hypothetical protein